MNASIYVNVPLAEDEHAMLVKIAAREGRAKGQQLRTLAVQAMNALAKKKGGKRA